jgi:hypothetical protein
LGVALLEHLIAPEARGPSEAQPTLRMLLPLTSEGLPARPGAFYANLTAHSRAGSLMLALLREGVPTVLMLICIVFLIISAPTASAYIDPGTGSLVVQIIIAGVLAASVSIKVFWKKIKAFFTARSSRKKHGV